MPSEKSNKPFFPHIQGLRGLAILLVLLFHFSPTLCPNGYYGVNLFFVIAGFLLFRNRFNIENNFSIVDFFRRKIFRIIPAVFFIISFVLFTSICLMPAKDMLGVYTDAEYAIRLSTNIQLSSEANLYFSKNTRILSLMHLWYICVLLQAFAIFAIIFYIWNKFKLSKKWRILTLIVIGLASLSITCQPVIQALNLNPYINTSSTYSQTTARLWEIIAGGLFALMPPIKWKKLASWAAFFALALFIFFALYKHVPSQKYMLLIVIMSGVLVVGASHGITAHILQSKYLHVLGKYSYSLYIAHWPIIWVTEYLFGEEISLASVIFATVHIIILTALTYHLFEKPKFTMKRTLSIIASAPVLAFAVITTKGFENTLHVSINKMFTEPIHQMISVPSDAPLMTNSKHLKINTWGKKSPQGELMYYLGNPNSPITYLLLGDSHAFHFRQAFDLLGKQNHWHGVYLNSYVNPFLKDEFHPSDNKDHVSTNAIVEWLQDKASIKYVIIAQWWFSRFNSNYTKINVEEEINTRTEQLRNFCVRMNEIGKKVIVIADTPFVSNNNPGRFVRSYKLYGNLFKPTLDSIICKESEFLESSKAANKMFEKIKTEGLIHILYPHKHLMNENVFVAYDDKGLIVWDSHHLTYYGALKALTPFCEELSSFLKADAEKPNELLPPMHH